MVNNYDNYTLDRINSMIEAMLQDSIKHLKDVEFKDHMESIKTMGRIKVLYEIEINILKIQQHKEDEISTDIHAVK